MRRFFRDRRRSSARLQGTRTLGLVAGALGLVAGAGLLAAPALADEVEAETCLRTMIWAGYDDGYAVRTATTTSLGAGEHRIYLVSLFKGNDYKVQVCADAGATDVDIVLHDAQGKELARDTTDDREPSLSFKAKDTGTYYVAVYAAQLAEGQDKAGVAMAVTYR